MTTVGLLMIIALIAAVVVIGGSTHSGYSRRGRSNGMPDQEPLEPPRTDSGIARLNH